MSTDKLSAANSQPTDKLDAEEVLSKRIDRLEEQVKEREIYFFRAVKTLIEDFKAYQRGEKKDFNAALFGAIFAYLRPRMVLVFGSVGAFLFAGLQFWVLYNQNNILEQQNQLLQTQNATNELQSFSNILSSFDPDNPVRTEIAIQQLTEYGDAGFPVLVNIASSSGPLSLPLAMSAMQALLGQVDRHDARHVTRVFDALGQVLLQLELKTFEVLRSESSARIPPDALTPDVNPSPSPAGQDWFLPGLPSRHVNSMLGQSIQYVQSIRERITTGELDPASIREYFANFESFARLVGAPWFSKPFDYQLFLLVRHTHGLSADTEDRTIPLEIELLSRLVRDACGRRQQFPVDEKLHLLVRKRELGWDNLVMKERIELAKEIADLEVEQKRIMEEERIAKWKLHRLLTSWLEKDVLSVGEVNAVDFSGVTGYPVPSVCRAEVSSSAGWMAIPQ